MNERIEELSLQCIRYKLIAEGARSDFDYQKFAELIVKECMELTKQCSTGKGIHDLFADEIIAEHFGVEE
jgi:hypothetical protein